MNLHRAKRAAAASVGMTLATLAVPAHAQAPDQIRLLSLQTGHSLILDEPGLTRVAVGDGRIAGVVPIGTSQLVLNGKSAGHTTLFVFRGNRHSTYEITVSEQSFDDVARIVRAAVDEPDVEVVAFNDNLVVRGSVADNAAFARLEETLRRFNGVRFTSRSGSGKDGAIVNAVRVVRPLGALQSAIAAVPGGHDLRVDPDDKGNVVVSGGVPDRASAEAVLGRVRGLAGPYLAADGKVVDRLGVDRTSQVDVKVYVLEVDDTAQSQLGLRLQTLQPGAVNGAGANPPYAVSPGTSIVAAENPLSVTGSNHPFNVGPFFRVSALAPTLDLLLTQGHARLLSSPDLVSQPGQDASFLVGGEIPIPISSGLGTVSVVFKEFGVKLDVNPTILGNGAVEAKITPEVSELDFANGVSINGFVIPALKTSRISTDLITQSGESIVMGGLLRRVESKVVQKFPLLGDIPVLGQLFRSTSYQRSDSDVVFVMTPTVITR